MELAEYLHQKEKETIMVNKNSQNVSEPKPSHFNKIRVNLQILSTLLISGSMTHAGLTLAFPNLLTGDFDEHVTSSFASIAALSTPVGTIFTSLITDRIGRKRTLIAVKLVCILTWITLSTASNTTILYMGSVLGGITRGALTSTCSAYVSEITSGDYRQLSLSLLTVFFTFGVFIITLLHIIFKWRQAATSFVVIFVLLLILIVLIVPESPHWLAIIKLDLRKARLTLRKYNPDEMTFNREWNLIQQKLETENTSTSVTKIFDLLRQRKVYKPCIILVGLLLFQQFCGIYPISSFTLYMIPKISNKLGSVYLSEIFLITGILRLVISCLMSLILTKFNQKQLLLISFIGMHVTSLPISCIKYFVNSDSDDSDVIDWILMTLVVHYIITSYIGAMGIPWTIVFELLPTEARGLIGPLLIGFGYSVMGLQFKIFPVALQWGHIWALFLFFTVVSLLGTIFIQYCIPETKGKSLYEIEMYFSKNRINKRYPNLQNKA